MNALTVTILGQTDRALWSVGNVIEALPEGLWDRGYCGMPMWKHVYHMLHSLDRWLINPDRYEQPGFHVPGLDDLDTPAGEIRLSKEELTDYFHLVERRIRAYLGTLDDGMLGEHPGGCRWSRFELILAQYRHLHTHLGMLMGFAVADTGLWPRVAGLEDTVPPLTDTLYF